MFKKLKIKLRKIRIFKRLKAIKAENFRLKGQLISYRKKEKSFQNELLNAVSELNLLNDDYLKIKDKHMKASKRIADITGRRNEFLARVQEPMKYLPDDVITGDESTYRVWLMEPFMEDKYIPYKRTNRLGSPFIDGPSAARGFVNATEEEKKTD